MRKTQILVNKSVYLGLSILDVSKTVLYEFWYDYVKQKTLLYEYRQFHCSLSVIHTDYYSILQIK